MVSATGFWWGRAEHRFERWTNYLLLVTFLWFFFSLYMHSWCFVKISFVLVGITFGVHLLARACHIIEKYYHNK
jgi:hypothetical protein